MSTTLVDVAAKRLPLSCPSFLVDAVTFQLSNANNSFRSSVRNFGNVHSFPAQRRLRSVTTRSGILDNKRHERLETQSMRVPVKWLAPETLRAKVYTNKTDLWSFGVLIWEIFSDGREQYPGMSNSQVKKHVLHGYRMETPEAVQLVPSLKSATCSDRSSKRHNRIRNQF